jgi:arginyl-tRNA synthetase
MSSKYKALAARRSINVAKRILKSNNTIVPKQCDIVQHMKLQRSPQGTFSIKLPLSALLSSENDIFTNVSKFIEEFETDNYISGVLVSPGIETDSRVCPDVQFCLKQNNFIADIVRESINLDVQNLKLGNTIDLFPNGANNNRNCGFKKNTVVVDFSSPNVAKPFHMGHLRSTIIGNYIANIHEAVGHNVVRLNYLGDWGTQFGYLLAGLSRYQIEKADDISNQFGKTSSVINSLYKIYVDANKEADKDPVFNECAKSYFTRLENGDNALKKQWEFIRNATIDELDKTYKRLNVRIDVYHGESMYGIQQDSVANELNAKGLLKELEDGRKIVEVNNNDSGSNNSTKVIITKSDGSSLYITRDIAAAIDRKKLFEFDKMLYVVEKAQNVHFINLFKILEYLGYRWAEQLEHISFGRIQGFSSRKGTAVFLSDILDEGKLKMIEQQSQSENTKVQTTDKDFHEIADTLAISAVVCNDLKQKRRKDYEFNWDKVLHSKGDSGIKLQYTHARLTSLLSKMSLLNSSEEYENNFLEQLTEAKCFDTLVEQEAVDLLYNLSIFEEVVNNSYSQLEPCFLVNYLFRLCNATSKALKILGVQTAPNQQTADERLALFAAARANLRIGIKLLGLKPLNRI